MRKKERNALLSNFERIKFPVKRDKATRPIIRWKFSMPYNDKAIQKMEIAVPEKASKAIKAAYKQALNAGQAVLIVLDGALYRVNPTGEREFIRPVPKRIAVTKGQKIRLH